MPLPIKITELSFPEREALNYTTAVKLEIPGFEPEIDELLLAVRVIINIPNTPEKEILSLILLINYVPMGILDIEVITDITGNKYFNPMGLNWTKGATYMGDSQENSIFFLMVQAAFSIPSLQDIPEDKLIKTPK